MAEPFGRSEITSSALRFNGAKAERQQSTSRIADQVAQKLHACTGPAAAGRARDVLDILLIDTLGELNYAEPAVAARGVFEERATHAFPPVFIMPGEWRPELETLA